MSTTRANWEAAVESVFNESKSVAANVATMMDADMPDTSNAMMVAGLLLLVSAVLEEEGPLNNWKLRAQLDALSKGVFHTVALEAYFSEVEKA